MNLSDHIRLKGYLPRLYAVGGACLLGLAVIVAVIVNALVELSK